MKITQQQNKRLHALIGQLKIDKDAKRDLVKYYSSQRSDSSRDLLYNEANNLIKHLESFGQTLEAKPAQQPYNDDPGDRMRKKIIHYAHLMKWETGNGRADMARINEWCKKSGQFKKPLNQHSEAELAHLVSQFEKVYTSFLKSIGNGK